MPIMYPNYLKPKDSFGNISPATVLKTAEILGTIIWYENLCLSNIAFCVRVSGAASATMSFYCICF